MILLIGVLSTNNSLLKIAGAVFSIKRIHSFQSCIPTWLSNTIMKTQNSWRYFLVFLYPSAHKNKFLTLLDIKKPTTLLWVFFCGERGSISTFHYFPVFICNYLIIKFLRGFCVSICTY